MGKVSIKGVLVGGIVDVVTSVVLGRVAHPHHDPGCPTHAQPYRAWVGSACFIGGEMTRRAPTIP
jgi:hypothetical protein